MEVSDISRILGGQKVLHVKIQRRHDLIALSDHGVTKDALLNLARYLSLPLGQLAQLLPISERTLQRYARNRHFNRVVSEHILHIAEVAAKGIEIFGDKDDFLSWMNIPSVALGNKKPLSLLSSRFGTEMVLDELGRMEHGVVS
jgi:putative toxin-antitoxin system antitoxin component (TIGR02293 family)